MKDYNVELEAILDEKNFSEDVQGLILSMFYKIENAYTDYHEVKKQTPTKEIFIEKIISVIKQYCNEVEIIKPRGKKNETEYSLDIEKGKLKCFPNEFILLFCLFQLIVLEKNEEDLIDDAVSDMIKTGNSLNYQEVIRDFNGWSWSDSLATTEELEYNLVYQNLLFMLGNKRLEKVLESPDRLATIKQELEEYELDIVESFLYVFSQIAVLLKANKNKIYKEKIQDFFRSIN